MMGILMLSFGGTAPTPTPDATGYFETANSRAIIDMFNSLTNLNGFVKLLEAPFVDILFVIGVALAFAFFIFGILSEMMKMSLFGTGSYVKVIIAVTIVGLLLNSYGWLIKSTNTEVNKFITNYMSKSVVEDIVKTIQSIKEKDRQENEAIWNDFTQGKIFAGLGKVASKVGKGVYGYTSGVLKYILIDLSTLITMAVVGIIAVVRNLSMAFSVAVGGIALTFLIIPGMQQVAFGWMKQYLYLLLWPVAISFILWGQKIIFGQLFAANHVLGLGEIIIYDAALIVILIKSFHFIPDVVKGVSSMAGAAAAIVSGSVILGTMMTRSALASLPQSYTQKEPGINSMARGGLYGGSSRYPTRPPGAGIPVGSGYSVDSSRVIGGTGLATDLYREPGTGKIYRTNAETGRKEYLYKSRPVKRALASKRTKPKP
jgi:hypothetical protein